MKNISREVLQKLLPLFLIFCIVIGGFSLIIIRNSSMEAYKQKVNRKINNLNAKIAIGEAIVMDLQKVETCLYKLTVSDDLRQQQLIFDNTQKLFSNINTYLNVIEKGGIISRNIPINTVEKDEMILDISYRVSNSQYYIVEILELKPELIELEEKMKKISEVTAFRNQMIKKNYQRTSLVTEAKKIRRFVKETEPLFARMAENAHKLLFEGQRQLKMIRAKNDKKQKTDLKLEFYWAIASLFAVLFLIGFVLHQIFRAREVLEDTVDKLQETREDLEFKNREIVKANDSLEVKVIDRTRKLTATNGKLIDEIKSREKAENKLFQAQKMESIGTLAGGIAHDFNNILFPIMGHTEMLIQDVSKDSPLRSSLDQIYAGTLRARDLVKQILTFSRQENSELMLIKMQPIVKEALKFIRSSIPATIDIKHNIDPGCGLIKADPTKIYQIVMNLSTNAFHAMKERGGELIVNLKEIEFGEHDLIDSNMIPGLYVCLSVSDTGTGMNKEVISKIFDPFFTTKEIGKGTGMGLSVVHGIVTSMKGSIYVYSEPGKGTEFKAYFPVDKSSFEQKHFQSNKIIQGGVEQILLVDDEKEILTMEKEMLERLGYQVTICSNSVEALKVFRGRLDNFDLVITDMAMPNMSGDRLSVELVKIRPDIPILLCTGFSDTMSEQKAASIGIKGFLLKPIIMKDIALKIREVLKEN